MTHPRFPSTSGHGLRLGFASTFCLLGALWALGCGGGSQGADSGVRTGGSKGGNGGTGGTGGGGGSTTTLGLSCGSGCNGTFCQAGGTSVSRTCGSSTGVTYPCLGTATGMYCTQSCASDADCAPANRTMRCLTTCPRYGSVAGLCWSQSDYSFMVASVCGTAQPDAAVPVRTDAALDRSPDIVPGAPDRSTDIVIVTPDAPADRMPDIMVSPLDIAADRTLDVVLSTPDAGADRSPDTVASPLDTGGDGAPDAAPDSAAETGIDAGAGIDTTAGETQGSTGG